MEQFLFPALVIGFIASLIAAYSAGWHSGHDMHHDDDPVRHSRGDPKPPSNKPTLYV